MLYFIQKLRLVLCYIVLNIIAINDNNIRYKPFWYTYIFNCHIHIFLTVTTDPNRCHNRPLDVDGCATGPFFVQYVFMTYPSYLISSILTTLIPVFLPYKQMFN